MNDDDQKRILNHAQQLSEQASQLAELSKTTVHLQQQIQGLYLIADANNSSITGLIKASQNFLAGMSEIKLLVVQNTKDIAELRAVVNDYIKAIRNGSSQ